jgi:DNA-binding LytR/AlgR family response regulator
LSAFRAFSIDDERGAANALRALLKETPDVALAASFTAAAQALPEIAAGNCDLLFLDVAMPGMTGLQFLRSLDNPPVTVLVTAHAGHALDAFELGVRDYLLKPVSAERLAQCLDRVRPLLGAARQGGPRAPMRLSIKLGNGYRLVDPMRVIRVEAAGNFSTVHTDEGAIFASEPLKDLQERLSPFGFERIHKSHLLSMRFVSSVSANEVRLSEGSVLPLGRAYRAAFTAAIGPRDIA